MLNKVKLDANSNPRVCPLSEQADICATRQFLVESGVPAENIIVFVMDDIASEPDNPFPNQIFNFPTPLGIAGRNVYEGCVNENTYTGANVTLKNFLAVLEGNAEEATGPVLQSNRHSRVFLNLVDHGGPGVFCFPNNEELLTAHDLNASLTTAYEKGLFGSLTLYLESCESGSMFEEILEKNALPVYAVTASGPDESSWGCYCPGESPAQGLQDFVNGTELGTCLGDLFSVSWLQVSMKNCSSESSSSSPCSQTLQSNFMLASNLTSNMSTPHQYGNITLLTPHPIGEFFSRLPLSPLPLASSSSVRLYPSPASSSLLPSRLASRNSLKFRYEAALKREGMNGSNTVRLHEMMEHEKSLSDFHDSVAEKLRLHFNLIDNTLGVRKTNEFWACYKTLLSTWSLHCGSFTDYSLTHTHVLSEICLEGWLSQGVKSIISVCPS